MIAAAMLHGQPWTLIALQVRVPDRPARVAEPRLDLRVGHVGLRRTRGLD